MDPFKQNLLLRCLHNGPAFLLSHDITHTHIIDLGCHISGCLSRHLINRHALSVYYRRLYTPAINTLSCPCFLSYLEDVDSEIDRCRCLYSFDIVCVLV